MSIFTNIIHRPSVGGFLKGLPQGNKLHTALPWATLVDRLVFLFLQCCAMNVMVLTASDSVVNLCNCGL